MVEVNLNTKEYQDGFLFSFGGMLCIVIVIVGIKFKWFKRRLDFQQLTLQNTNVSQNTGDILSQGVFRLRQEEDAFIETERYKSMTSIPVHSSGKSNTIPRPKNNNKNMNNRREIVSLPPNNNIINYNETSPAVDVSNIQRIHSEITLEEQQNQIDITQSKTSMYQKNNTLPKKFSPKIVFHSSSSSSSCNEIDTINDKIIQRRLTGILPFEKINLNAIDDGPNSYVKDYSQGLTFSSNNPTTYYPDLLTTIRNSQQQQQQQINLSNEYIVVHKDMQQSEENNSIYSKNENDGEESILEKIRIPVPEPRRTVPIIQPKKKLNIDGGNSSNNDRIEI